MIINKHVGFGSIKGWEINSSALHSSLAISKATQEHFEMNFLSIGRYILLLILVIHLIAVAGKSWN